MSLFGLRLFAWFVLALVLVAGLAMDREPRLLVDESRSPRTAAAQPIRAPAAPSQADSAAPAASSRCRIHTLPSPCDGRCKRIPDPRSLT